MVHQSDTRIRRFVIILFACFALAGFNALASAQQDSNNAAPPETRVRFGSKKRFLPHFKSSLSLIDCPAGRVMLCPLRSI